mmetsp:Transcript_40240/g.29678  ORF Transcript_40240/g.29678 Transcript_40240/m.29678 type:complete len:106 (+) Transcript_40240:32-349(+)
MFNYNSTSTLHKNQESKQAYYRGSGVKPKQEDVFEKKLELQKGKSWFPSTTKHSHFFFNQRKTFSLSKNTSIRSSVLTQTLPDGKHRVSEVVSLQKHTPIADSDQ